MKTIETLDPKAFRGLITTIGELPSSFVDSMSYYEMIAWLVDYIKNNVIPAVNNNAEAIKEIQNWLETLDLQDEVNTKLEEMVESGELQEIIEAFITSEVRYKFPRFVSGAASQDFSLVTHDYNGEKTFILIDAGTGDQISELLAMLNSETCTHIDYFILTHYDVDHTGGIETLINNNYIDTDTTVYLPAQVTNYPEAYQTRMATVNALFNNASIPTVTHNENATETIGTLTLTFGNCQKSVVESYATKSANDDSQVVLFEHKNRKVLYGADATLQVQKRLYQAGFLKSSVDVFKAHHHLIDQFCYEPYINQINPIYAVQTSFINDFVKNNYGISEEGRILKDLGTKIYSSVMQPDFITFVSQNGAISCKTGIPLGLSSANISRDYYVDETASKTAIQDGTEEHPFSEIMQAVGCIPQYSSGEYTIHVAAGNYGNKHGAESAKNRIVIGTNKNTTVAISGADKDTVTIVPVIVTGANVKLSNVTINIDLDNGIYAQKGANVVIDTVDIKSSTSTTSTTHNGVVLRTGSKLMATSFYITNANYGIAGTDSEVMCGANLKIGTLNSSPTSFGRCLVDITSITFDNDTDANSYIGYYKTPLTPNSILAPEQTDYGTSYTLTKSISLFDWIEIFYISNENALNSIKILTNGNNTIKGYFQIPQLGESGSKPCYYKMCKFSINNKTITLSQGRYYLIATSGTTISEGDAYFNITKVIGGKF